MADFNEEFNKLTDTPDTTNEMDPSDIETNKIWAVLAYISWFFIISLLVAKDSKFAKFHINQGIVLAIAELAGGIVFGILTQIPVLGILFGILEAVLFLVCFVFSILGIINAAQGQAKELPIIGSIHLLK